MMSMSDSCKDGASKSNNDEVYEMKDMLHNLKTVDNEVNVSVCANCGKEGDDINNICNKCKQVKYCNATCKKKHRHKHKKDCEEHLRLAAEHSDRLHDEKLFKQPPTKEDCPICFLLLPSLGSGKRYQTCCGKVICSGCFNAPLYDSQGNQVDNQKCQFCRTPKPTTVEELIKRNKKRVELNDPLAIYNLGVYYSEGLRGLAQDHTKALELFHRAAELGYAEAYSKIGSFYFYGKSVDVDKKKATHYCELAAIGGDTVARFLLGCTACCAGNMDKALKHFLIAFMGGSKESLEKIQQLYIDGNVTKEDYTKALQVYQEYLGEIKSDQRDKAAAADNGYRYY